MLAILLILLFVVLALIRVPMAIIIGIIIVLYLEVSGSIKPVVMTLDAFNSLNKFPFLAVPLFILAGQLMATGGVAKKFLNLADELVGGLRGGYALTAILASVFFADLSGSSPATVAAIGTLMIPAMIRQGYRPGFSAAVCACAGVLSILIPPSNPMIMYALVGNVSVSRLFLGGFIPGFLMAFGLAVPAYFVSRKNNWGGRKEKSNWRTKLKALWEARWALLVPIIILGGIYSGIFTPTESAAVACIYAFIAGKWLYREFTWRDVPKIFRATLTPIVTAMLIVVFGVIMGQIMTQNGVPQALATGIAHATDSQVLTLVILILLLLFIGTFMDVVAALIILTPLLLPIADKFGVAPLSFGMIMIMGLSVGFVTPPFGANLFIANQISDVRIHSVFRDALPLIAGMLISVLLVTFIPWLTLVLPHIFLK